MRIAICACLIFLLLPSEILVARPAHKKRVCHGILGDTEDRKQQILDSLKNRDVEPTAIDSTISIDDILAPGKDSARFTAMKAVRIAGYVLDDTLEGPESCNCHSRKSGMHDYHIYLGKDKHTTKKSDCMVVELTPAFRKKHPEWTKKFVYGLQGKMVTVEGWLMYDIMHRQNSKKYHAGHSIIWRNTCWEVHPVSLIQAQ
jgi:hypothetical protein